MTLASNLARVEYRGDGTRTEFPITFRFLDNLHIGVYTLNVVTQVETLKVLNSDYTLSGADRPAGGTLTFTTAPSAAEIIVIIRDVPYDQLINFRENDAFSANRNEFAYDKITMMIQQLDEVIRRGVLLKITSDDAPAPEQAGFTNAFPAEIDVEVGDGSFEFHEVVPSTSGTWVQRTGGLEGVAWPLPHCLQDWEDDIPSYVLIYTHKDEDENIIYVFDAPPPCSVEV